MQLNERYTKSQSSQRICLAASHTALDQGEPITWDSQAL
jgi:hypothetical protein